MGREEVDVYAWFASYSLSTLHSLTNVVVVDVVMHRLNN